MTSCISLIPAQKNLSIQMYWRQWWGRKRDGEGQGENTLFQKLSLLEEETRAGRGGAQGGLFLTCNWNLWGLSSSLQSGATCQWHKLPRQFILSALSPLSKLSNKCSRSHTEGNLGFPSKSATSFQQNCPLSGSKHHFTNYIDQRGIHSGTGKK